MDSCLDARIISPSVDNSQDVKKLSWEWFNLILLGVPKASRTFDLDPKSHLELIIINYQLDYSKKEVWFYSNIEILKVSTALVPITQKKNKSVNRFSTISSRPPFSQLPASYFFLKHFYKFYFYDMFIFIKTFLYVW